MENFKEWANQIANDFASSGITPTESLKKLASVNDLSPDQVKLLATETNKFIHQQKYASADDKYHAANFPLADAKEAIANLQSDGGEAKVAADWKEPVVSKPMPDMFRMFGVDPSDCDDPTEILKTASVKGESRQMEEKLAMLKQKLGDNVVVGEHAKHASERRFIKTARQFILQTANSNDERLKCLGMIDHFAKQGGLKKIASIPLAKTTLLLAKEGLLEPGSAKVAAEYFMSKSADEKAPQDLISPHLEARVINGKHPLYIALKTHQDNSAALNLNQERYQLVDDRLKIFRQKVRAL
jgi:hypothetical protein